MKAKSNKGVIVDVVTIDKKMRELNQYIESEYYGNKASITALEQRTPAHADPHACKTKQIP